MSKEKTTKATDTQAIDMRATVAEASRLMQARNELYSKLSDTSARLSELARLAWEHENGVDVSPHSRRQYTTCGRLVQLEHAGGIGAVFIDGGQVDVQAETPGVMIPTT